MFENTYLRYGRYLKFFITVLPGHGQAHDPGHHGPGVYAYPQLEGVGGPMWDPEIVDGCQEFHSCIKQANHKGSKN